MDNNVINGKNIRSGKNIAKMIILTAIGIFYYMIPFKFDGEITMAIAVLENAIMDNISFYPMLVTFFSAFLVIISVYFSIFRKEPLKNEYLRELFQVSYLALLWRIAGAAILILAAYNIGPEFIWNENTGGFLQSYLIPALLLLFAFALMFISLLLDFGGIEVLGGILQPIFKPLFKLSGSAALMSLVSWFGSGTTGMILTDKAHKKNELTTRDSNLIVFGFAIISFPVTFIYSTGLGGLEVKYFPYLTLTIILCTLVTSFIIVRIPPVSKKSAKYLNGSEKVDVNHDGKTRFKRTLDLALDKASKGPSLFKMIGEGLKETFAIAVEVFPLITVIATVVLVLSNYTTVFDILAAPIAPILETMGLPEASTAAPSFFTGFADLILPFLGSATVTSQLTKFVIGVVAIIQVYCMSEGGVILMKSSLDIKFKDLVIVFILKTVISIPIAYYMGVLFGIV